MGTPGNSYSYRCFPTLIQLMGALGNSYCYKWYPPMIKLIITPRNSYCDKCFPTLRQSIYQLSTYIGTPDSLLPSTEQYIGKDTLPRNFKAAKTPPHTMAGMGTGPCHRNCGERDQCVCVCVCVYTRTYVRITAAGNKQLHMGPKSQEGRLHV
jgi:hypothetical protein